MCYDDCQGLGGCESSRSEEGAANVGGVEEAFGTGECEGRHRIRSDLNAACGQRIRTDERRKHFDRENHVVECRQVECEVEHAHAVLDLVVRDAYRLGRLHLQVVVDFVVHLRPTRSRRRMHNFKRR